MRYANITFFVASAILGFTLSIALMWQLPFAVFSVDNNAIEEVVAHLGKAEPGFNASVYYVTAALKDLMAWQGVINYVMAVVCSILAVAPALATIRLAEGKLFERRADRGWKMLLWMTGLGALVVAIYPAPICILPFLAISTILISGYIVTYQWPKVKAAQRTRATASA